MTLDTFLADLSNTPPDTPVVVLLGDNHENIVASDLQKAFGVATVLYQAKVSNQGRGANLRSSPGMSNNVIRLLPDGTLLDVLSTPIVTIAPYNWVYVRIASSGAPGWIALPLIARVTLPPTPRPIVGVHVLQDGANISQQLVNALNGRLLSGATVLNDANLSRWWAAHAKYVLHRNTPTEGLVIPDDPTAAANAGSQAYTDRRAWIDSLDNGVYVQIENEMTWAPGHGAFWLAFLEACTQAGRKGVIGAYAVGQPEPAQWATMIPALQFAMAHGHVVALHVYCQSGTPVGQLSADFSDFEGRPMRLYAAVPADARPALIISECGHSFARGEFEGIAETVHFAGQMQSIYQRYSYVQSLHLYTLGQIGGWAASSIDSAANALAAAITSQRFP